jgi:hypothetical protein
MSNFMTYTGIEFRINGRHFSQLIEDVRLCILVVNAWGGGFVFNYGVKRCKLLDEGVTRVKDTRKGA